MVNKAAQLKRIEESMHSSGMQMIDMNRDDGYRPMSRYQADNIIAEASVNLTESEQEAVQKWSAEILSDLETKSQQSYGRRHDVFGGNLSRFNY